MGFKESPPRIVDLTTFIENLPRRAAGRPLIDARTRDPEICSPQYRSWILGGFYIAGVVATQIRGLGGECVKLANCLDTKTPVLTGNPTDVYVTCANCTPSPTGAGQPSSSSGSSMQLCVPPQADPELTRRYLERHVFLELVRICGGKLLDAWALWYYLFTSSSTASGRVFYAPLPGVVKDEMCRDSTPLAGMRWGTYMAWSPYWGRLYAKYVYPDGSWGTVATGSLTGHSHPYWQGVCP